VNLARKSSRTVLSFLNWKECALYFDHVICFSSALQIAAEFESGKADDTSDSGAELLPEKFRDDREFRIVLAQTNVEITKLWLESRGLLEGAPYSARAKRKLEYEAAGRLQYILDTYELEGLPIEYPEVDIFTSDPPKNFDDIAITLSGQSVIDAQKAPWRQIKEVRKDPSSVKKLRRFRVFATENYVGKPKSYIVDDISQKIDDYNEEVKKWGFETKVGYLTTLLDSKVLAGAAAGTLISSLAGQPLSAIIAATAGVTIELGKFGLDISRRRFALRELMRTNPVSYMAHARKVLGVADR